MGERKDGFGGKGLPSANAGDRNDPEGEGEPSSAHDIDMDELNDWSTSIGKSVSVLVGDGSGEGKREEGKLSMSGEEENMSMMLGLNQVVS